MKGERSKYVKGIPPTDTDDPQRGRFIDDKLRRLGLGRAAWPRPIVRKPVTVAKTTEGAPAPMNATMTDHDLRTALASAKQSEEEAHQAAQRARQAVELAIEQDAPGTALSRALADLRQAEGKLDVAIGELRQIHQAFGLRRTVRRG